MYEIDRSQFGSFLQELRKDKGYTQKELAAKLYVSDKAVSKWERGLSLPDTALLIPIAEVLDVTVTELLKGRRLEKTAQLDIDEVEELVTNTLEVSAGENRARDAQKKKWRSRYLICTGIAGLELLVMAWADAKMVTQINLLLGVGMAVLFGGWFCLGVKETLPNYYDENEVSTYSDGIFRMNLVGIHFNNSNWPHIVKVGRVWTLAASVILPLLYAAWYLFVPESIQIYSAFLTLPVILGMFVPMIAAAKKYE